MPKDYHSEKKSIHQSKKLTKGSKLSRLVSKKGTDSKERAVIGARQTDLSRLGRVGLTPEPEVAGLIQSLDLGPRVRQQLRTFLEQDTAPPLLQAEGRSEEILEERAVRGAELSLMEAQARVLRLKAQDMYGQTDLPPLWRAARDLIDRHSPQTGLLLHGDGRFVLRELPDQGPCEHIQPLLEQFKTTTRQPDEVSPGRVWEKMERKAQFSVQPEEVVFRELTIGKTFHARLRVRNEGDHSASFSLHGPSSRGVFSLSSRGYKGQVLAPGLSVRLDLHFTCRDKLDRADEVHLLAGDQHLVVPVRAAQPPPLLTSVSCPGMLTLDQEDGKGSLLEFDKCFVGDTKRISLRLENQGPAARFFIMSETDWNLQALEGVRREDLTVVTEEFLLRPAYFCLEPGAGVELELEFRPTCAGSHVARVYLACDNATLRPLDLLGEALTYYKDLVRFQNFEKRYNIFIEDDITAKYYFYIGEFYAHTPARRTFEVNNTSLVEMEYSWEERGSGGGGPIQVSPEKGVLGAEREVVFTASCDTARLTPGRHRAVFAMLVNGIPVNAFPEKYREEITLTGTSDKGSIEVAVIEIWIDIVIPPISLKENYIHLVTKPDRTAACKLYVMNLSKVRVTLAWEEAGCSICPATATLPPVATRAFTFRFSSHDPGHYTGYLRARVKEFEGLSLEALYQVDVRGGLEGGATVADFGILRVGQLFRDSLVLPSDFRLEKNVKLKEFTLQVDKDGKSRLNKTKGVAEYIPQQIGPGKINLNISNKVEEVSLILLDLKCGQGHFFVLVLIDFQELDVSLTPAKHVFSKTLFVGKEEAVRLRLVNHKLLGCRFTLKERFGPDSSAVDVRYSPAHGTIGPGGTSEVTVTLDPKKAGFFSDVFIPCHVDGREGPLVAQVVGRVKDKEVKISWPTEDQTMIVLWPEEECDEANPKPNSVQVSKKTTEIFMSSGAEEGSHEVGKWEEEEEGSLKAECSSLCTVPYEKWPIVGGRYYGAEFLDKALERDYNTPWTCESLNERMKTLSVQERKKTYGFFNKRALCFDMKLFEESTRYVEIFNVTPTPCYYKAKLIFFKTIKNPEGLGPNMTAELQNCKRKQLEEDCPELIKRKWEKLIRAEVGLGVVVSCREGRVEGREGVRVGVTAYGLAWGHYLDTLQVKVLGLPPFHLPLSLTISDSPVFFTYSPDTTRTPVLRFPSVMPNVLRRQTVYLKNRCPLPLKVVWSVFAEPDSPPPGEHFTLQLELHPEDPADFCKVHLTDYVGQLNSPYYSVEPRISELAPYGKTPVRILLDTASLIATQAVRYLKAVVLGTLYVQQEVREKRMSEEYMAYYRPDGFNIKQIELKLETKTEVPTIRLINSSKENAFFQVKTRDIFCSPTKSYSEKRKFTLRNCASRKVYLKLLSSCPFVVTRVVTEEGEMSVSEEIVVDKQKVFEIEITLQLTEVSIQGECDDSMTYLDFPGTLRREFICRERNYSENVFPLFLQILKPKLNISINPINFGQVLLEDTKTQIVAVTSQYGDEPYHITFKDKENVFHVSPQSGTIRPGYEMHLTVRFRPKKCRKYCTKVRLLTTTPRSEAIITVIGEGVDQIRDRESEEGQEEFDFFDLYCGSETLTPSNSKVSLK